MATGYMYKLIEMKEGQEFEYKWKDHDKTQPLKWDIGGGPGGPSQKLCGSIWMNWDFNSI